MNYGEWSKSIELDQTLTPNFLARDYGRIDENEESEGLRRPPRFGGMMGFELDRIASNSIKLDQTRTPAKSGETIAKTL